MYGRGGAGNISQAKEDSKKAPEGHEANLTPSVAATASGVESLSLSSSPPSPSSNTGQAYISTGRGGAGNWHQPTPLSQQGVFTQPVDATAMPTAATPQVSIPWHPEGQEMPLARTGRGGAGNFVWKSEEEAAAAARKAKEREADEGQMQAVRQWVEKNVEAGLTKPPGVVLGRQTLE